MLDKIGDHRVVFKSRQGNEVADRVAKEASNFESNSSVLFSTMSSWIQTYVEADKPMVMTQKVYVLYMFSSSLLDRSKKDLETRLLAFDDNLLTTTMAPILRSTPLVALLVLQISLLFFASTLPVSSGSEDSYTITGRVRIPASTAIGHAAKFSNIKVVLNGGQNITFLRPDGYFTFHKVPAGTHLIEVYALGFFFSPVRVDVSARHHGKVQATLTETRRSLTELVLEPLRADQYYEVNASDQDVFNRDLERRIVETEMELAQAKSQGYLKNQKSLSSSSSGNKKMLAVIGVYTGFGSHLKRNKFRGSWMPRDDALKKLEERGVIIRFVIGRSANRGDSLDRKIDQENLATKDFLILENHEEAQEELPKKVKFFYSAAVQNWDAEFYVKVDDNVDLDLEGLIGLLESRRGQDGAYIGCMKSGDVVTQEGSQWYEPEWWKFGDDKSYFRHATGSLVILSKNLAQYININSGLLKTYAFDDTTIGSWMIGVQATYIDDNRLCCSSTRQEKVCSMA
ncbi:hypothetical protein F2Q70_00034113 [Brassica cretica]|uniref:ER membrane protein complex subunit 7 beta-sandwich domain-containing protein n=1 Tax=Brassica cretica TaxID=69181 RepID=A0A8S9JW02_BRACR|nr:hypothetical protein F2Q70_00034113 [Brassica cretica]